MKPCPSNYITRRIAIGLALTALACTERRWTEVRHERACVTDKERAELTAAVLTCVKNGNPMSDEEGEDLVAECRFSMAVVVCPERRAMVYIRETSWASPPFEYDRRALP